MTLPGVVWAWAFSGVFPFWKELAFTLRLSPSRVTIVKVSSFLSSFFFLMK